MHEPLIIDPPGEQLEAPVLDARPRRRGAWSRRCPHCLSTALAAATRGALRCAACDATIEAPRLSEERASWEHDPRRDRAWDRYSRSGDLAATWGRSTDRQDGGPPPPGEEPEEMPPRVRSEAARGREDDVLDAARAEVTAHVDGLRAAAEQLRPLLLRAHRAVFEPEGAAGRRGRGRLREPSEDPRGSEALRGAVRVVSHVEPAEPGAISAEPAVDPDDVLDADASHFHALGERVVRDVVIIPSEEPARAPLEAPRRGAWRPSHLAMGWRGIEFGKLVALWFILVDSLRARGIEYAGSAERVGARSRRAEPFAGLRHALAVRYGVSEPREASPIPRHAMAKHKLPSGPVFGQIACKPTREYPSWAKTSGIDMADIEAAIRDARVGVRTYSEHGRIRRDPGRPLTPAEVELVRLVDAGEEYDHAVAKKRKTKRGERIEIDRLAVEQLNPREALARVRDLEGAPRTEHEARLALKAARSAIRRVLEDRGLIPSALSGADDGPRAQQGAERGERGRRTAERTSPFAGVGTGA